MSGPATSERHQVWLIDEGHGGHRVQSEGVIQALEATGVKLDVAYVPCTPKLRGFARPFARRLFSRLDNRWALRSSKWIADFTVPETKPPRFIISSGGRTAFASRALALSYDAPNIFVGNPRPFPAHWFRAVLSPVPIRTARNAILTQIVPNKITPALCQRKAEDYWAQAPKNCWAILIGGANRNHLFDRQDWEDIVSAMNALAAEHGVRWLIATSRRTGQEAEQIFKSRLKSEAIEQIVLQSEDSRPVVMPFLGVADLVFVTQDSLTMLSEAISSAKPVISIAPRRLKLDPKNFMAIVLRQYYNFEHFHPVTSSELSTFLPPDARGIANTLARDAMDRAVKQLRVKLGL